MNNNCVYAKSFKVNQQKVDQGFRNGQLISNFLLCGSKSIQLCQFFTVF